MLTLFNAQLLDVSMNSATLANTVGANGQISYDYEEGKIYVHDGFGNRFFSNTSVFVPYGFQGTTSGYTSGGYFFSAGTNTIDEFSFSADSNATDFGDLAQGRYHSAGQSSNTHGYNAGGIRSTPGPAVTNNIYKFSFAVGGTAASTNTLSVSRQQMTGQSSTVSGYTSGGASLPLAALNTVDKFPFAANGAATDVGDLSVSRRAPAGQTGPTFGYTSGGTINVIDKFPFAADSNSTDVGDLSQGRYGPTGQSSTISGYSSGGLVPTPANVNTIDRFPFATDANATDVGNIFPSRRWAAGQSSTVSGYTSGGAGPSGLNTIDKFPFATNANATDVGDLLLARYGPSGQQV